MGDDMQERKFDPEGRQAVVLAEEAMRRLNLVPRRTIVRGGTDGSRLTELGLPTPNLSTGEHNIHSPLEFTCLEEMDTAVRVVVGARSLPAPPAHHDPPGPGVDGS